MDRSAADELVVTSRLDSGQGSLRHALLNATTGDTIRFDTSVFPPTAPATIALTSESLPWLTQGNLTIDASDAGVILDGSGIVGTPEATLIDDVRMTFNDGPNVLINGDFSDGAVHWSTFDEGSGHSRSINASDFKSAPNSYQVTSSAQGRNANTYYDSAEQHVAF